MMTIIDHLSLGVPSIEDAVAFYDNILAPLGISRLATSAGFAAYGAGAVQFLVMTPADGGEAGVGNGCHLAFVASDPAAVDAFHAAALAAGGTDAGGPGPRPDYPKPGVYAAFVRDPFGNKLEAIAGGFAS